MAANVPEMMQRDMDNSQERFRKCVKNGVHQLTDVMFKTKLLFYLM